MAEDKKIIEEKKYAIISKESVKAFAEAAGHSGIQDDVASLLAEDVIYRLREAAQNGCQFMRHAKRKKLTTDDVNKALKNSDTPPVLGYGATEPMQFRQTREGEVYFVEDHDVNLPHHSCSSYVPYKPGHPTVKAQWIAVEGQQKGATLSQGAQGKTNGKVTKAVSEELLAYYDHITKAILGSDEELMKLALTDIRTNAKIAPLLPYLVNFVSNGVKTVSHDINQLTKLLHTVKALVKNQSLYLEPKPFLQMLVQSVTYCLLESLAASINPLNDHWALRDYAARLLAMITRNWNSPVNQLRRQNIRALREVLHDHTKPFCCHYGAVIGLLAFGTRVVERVLLPHLPSYWRHLQAVIEERKDTSYAQVFADAHKVYGAIMLAAEFLIRAKSQPLLHPEEVPSVCDADLDLDLGDLEPPVIDPLAAMDTDPVTSTPIKHGIQLSQDLLGPIIQLPDPNSVSQESLEGPVLELADSTLTGSPALQLLDIYSKMYEYFGDGLAARLPVHHVKNFYVPQQKEIFISLADDDSKKTGEELLEALLKTSVGREEELKSENHSYEPTPEDMEVDYDGDEKSEKSERSERSSRSDRSHSDENLSFLGDTDLTVKATVSDPSQGIKLYITKRRFKPPSPEEIKIEEPKPEPEPEPLPVPKPRPKIPIGDVFELEPMREPELKTFIFSFAGWVQKFEYRKPKMKTIFDESSYVNSELSALCQTMPPVGRKKLLEHRKQAHTHHGSTFSILGLNDLLL